MWRHDDIIDAAAQALRDAEARLCAEQAVDGLDALEEVEFHALLASGFASGPHSNPFQHHPPAPTWGVLREQPYPGDRTASNPPPHAPEAPEDDEDAPLARENDRQRCDLVLTPAPGLTLADPVKREKRAKAERQQLVGTLFEGLAVQKPPAVVPDPASIPPEDAFWLEVKLVGQFCYEAGIPGPNRTYASQLVRGAAADLAKLAKDPHIHHAALLIILFTETEEVARHDLVQAMHRCLDRGVAASTPLTASFPITDRIGNRVCTLAMIRAAR